MNLNAQMKFCMIQMNTNDQTNIKQSNNNLILRSKSPSQRQ